MQNFCDLSFWDFNQEIKTAREMASLRVPHRIQKKRVSIADARLASRGDK